MMGPPRCLAHFPNSRAFHTSSLQRWGGRPIARLIGFAPKEISELDHIEVWGRVRSIRHQKNIAFASIGDGSTIAPLQAVLTPEQAASISTGTVVELIGSWRPSPSTDEQLHELHVRKVRTLAPVDSAKYKLQKKYHTAEFLRSIPHLRLRTPLNSLLLRFRSKCRLQFSSWLDIASFTHIDTPILTSSDCEGGGETFLVTTEKNIIDETTFFKTKKHLTVSAQLHLEAAAQGLGTVWTLSNAFRAEYSDTSRHLSEFKMLEVESIRCENLAGIIRTAEAMLRDLVRALHTSREVQELIHGIREVQPYNIIEKVEETNRPSLLENRWRGMMENPWPKITYTEAIDILQSRTWEVDHRPVWGGGLTAEHEDYIASTVGNGSPVFVTHYPKAIKPFYMLTSETSTKHGEVVECFDLLVPGICEIMGGSMREHSLKTLISNMQQKKIVREGSNLKANDFGSLDWYVELRNQGYAPSGGFGLGFDRLIMYLSGVKNIREVVTFPSWAGH